MTYLLGSETRKAMGGGRSAQGRTPRRGRLRLPARTGARPSWLSAVGPCALRPPALCSHPREASCFLSLIVTGVADGAGRATVRRSPQRARDTSSGNGPPPGVPVRGWGTARLDGGRPRELEFTHGFVRVHGLSRRGRGLGLAGVCVQDAAGSGACGEVTAPAPVQPLRGSDPLTPHVELRTAAAVISAKITQTSKRRVAPPRSHGWSQSHD